jgi:hypothetical protein
LCVVFVKKVKPKFVFLVEFRFRLDFFFKYTINKINYSI